MNGSSFLMTEFFVVTVARGQKDEGAFSNEIEPPSKVQGFRFFKVSSKIEVAFVKSNMNIMNTFVILMRNS